MPRHEAASAPRLAAAARDGKLVILDTEAVSCHVMHVTDRTSLLALIDKRCSLPIYVLEEAHRKLDCVFGRMG